MVDTLLLQDGPGAVGPVAVPNFVCATLVRAALA